MKRIYGAPARKSVRERTHESAELSRRLAKRFFLKPLRRRDRVLAREPSGEALFIRSPGRAVRRLDLAEQAGSLPGEHFPMVMSEPAPLLPGNALELQPAAFHPVSIHYLSFSRVPPE